jgi:hypothetical protein
MTPNCGGRGWGCRVSANEYSCAHGVQINSGDLTPYLIYDADELTDYSDRTFNTEYKISRRGKALLIHRKKSFTSFPSPAGMSLTKLSLGKNNSVMTSLFQPRESLVVTSRLGTGNSRTFFYGVGRDHEGENAEEEHFSCLLFSASGWNKGINQTQYLQLEIVLRPRRISNEK